MCSSYKSAEATDYLLLLYSAYWSLQLDIRHFQSSEICPLQRPIITGPAIKAEKTQTGTAMYCRVTSVIPRRIGNLEQVAIRYHLDCCIRLYHDTNVETNPE